MEKNSQTGRNEQFITRKTLLQRASDPDDEAAWTEFVSYYEGFIRILILKMNVAPDMRDDLSQDILVKVWKKLSSYDADRAGFRSWLSGIIRNTVYAYFDTYARRQKKHTLYKSDHEVSGLGSVEEFDTLFQREWKVYITKLAIDKVRDSFSGKAMDVFELSLDEVPAEEIARRLNMQRFSVYSLKNRVKRRLLKEVEKLREELEF
ncbi:RNA polymerase sigma factor [Pontiella sulfatireligans]|uniref:RNA polymerase sigma-70 region 2 domain-containing protein n=1 Tax=Pontiella sulfatireligans TaxID=2750658 RepID=A0A6C2UGN3_9BACT|nr:sigma-70 family RNA polymerase sigma factor [Pontiella sulfatireligans]VGO19335.1 hypothetical protein SCARR_01393 [Pontiella sulfatireligans]